MPRKGPSTIEDRLHRIEGQIRGIEGMLERGSSKKQINIQIEAVISSLESVKLELIKDEMRESILKSIDEAVDMLK